MQLILAKTVNIFRVAVKSPPQLIALTHVRVVAKQAHLFLKIDTSKIRIRHLSETALVKFSKSTDFDYQDEKTDTGSWWQNFWNWLSHWLTTNNPRQQSNTPSYVTYIFLAIILGLIIVVIIKFAKQNAINVLGSASQKIDRSTGLPENIHAITFDDEIEKAIAQKNYRLAVRLLYLRTLKQLNDAGLISWKIEKTNTAYYNELKDSRQQQLFNLITRQFEYVWYGNFSIDAVSYHKISSLFNHFKQEVQ